MQRLLVNGREHLVAAEPETPLLLVLRNDLQLFGARPGCGVGQCGACTVLIDGRPERACTTPLAAVAGAAVTTVEGLGQDGQPHPLRRSFIAEQAAQCGFCIDGMIVTAAALLEETPDPSPDEIRAALADHLCRCGTHLRILRAILRAARREGPAESGPSDDGGVLALEPVAAPSQDGEALPAALRESPQLDAWLRLEEDGTVTLRSGKIELGQGLWTALVQIVAEELSLEPGCVRVQPVETGASPDEGYTAGSASIERSGAALRLAAAELRDRLLTAATAAFELPAEALEIRSGRFFERATGRPLGRYADLAASVPAGAVVTGKARPKPPDELRLVGRSLPRLDLPGKLAGEPSFVHDLALPGMVHGRVLRPPGPRARLEALASGAAEAVPGVLAVIRDGSFVAVVAAREEQAQRALSRLEAGACWQLEALPGTADLYRHFRELPAERVVVAEQGNPEAVLAGAARRIGATYLKPYQAHAPMAPPCAVALYEGERLTVWTHSQGVYPLRRELARLLALPEERLRVVHREGSGCYGHDGADDVAADAALLARALPGRPVRVQWGLGDTLRWDPFGSAMIIDLEGSVGEDGRMSALSFRVRTDVHTTRPNGLGGRLLAGWHLATPSLPDWPGPMEGGYRNAGTLYRVPDSRIEAAFVRGPVRVSALRTLGAFANTFANESFVDELAFLAAADPVAFRLEHLDDPRARAVLETAARRAGWQPHAGPSGAGLGVALARYKNSKAYVAQVAQVRVDSGSGEVRVERVVQACDAGRIVNPDGLRNQLEGGALQGIGRTLLEELSWTAEGPEGRDWDDYPVLGFAQVPTIDTVLLDRPELPSLGAGEAATTPIAAAVANAVFDATGIRLRRLPLTPERLRQRLLTMSEAELANVILG